MRFRYFDSEGTEVGVASVDALRFRIQKGAVTPETLLYDAAAGLWAPARQNALFRFLVEEEEDLLPPEMRPLMDRDEDGSFAESGSPGPSTSPVPWREGGGRFETVHLDDGVEVDLPEGEGVAHGASASSSEGTDAEDPGDVEAGAVGDGESEAPDEVGEVDADGFPDLELRSPAEEEWARGGRDRVGGSSSREVATDGATQGGDGSGVAPEGAGAPPATFESPAPSDSAGKGTRTRARRWSSRRRKKRTSAHRSSGRSRRGPPSLGGVAVLSVIVFFLVAVPLLVFGAKGGEGEGSAYALVGGLADDLVGAVGDDEGAAPDDGAVADGGPVEAGAPAASMDSAARDETSGGATFRLDDASLEGLITDVETAAAEDLAVAMRELRRSVGVPDSPPEIWLRGRYLAAADSFPEVRAYWEALGSYVASMEASEEDLYRGFVRDHVLALDLDDSGADRVTSRVLERHRATAADREAVYRDLSELAFEARALHETLAARSGDISYEPFDGTGLSRDPVIEAVAEDEALGEQIWSRLDRVLARLESLQGLRPVTTSQLQAALARAPGDVEAVLTDPGEVAAGEDSSAPPPEDPEPSPPDLRALPNLPALTDLPVPTQDVPDLDG